LLFDCRNDDLLLFRTKENHDHSSPSCIEKCGLSDEVKREIETLYALKLKPKHILAQLREKGLTIKNKTQISNYLKKIKDKIYGKTKISLGEFEQFCITHNNIPDDEDKGFIAAYYVNYGNDDDDDHEADDDEVIDDTDEDDDEDDDEDNGKKYRAFFTTRRLLKLATLSNIIHADATYKLVYEGSPVLINGNTDLDLHFHSFGLSVCSNEKTGDFVFIFKIVVDTLKKIG
jgi:hypothetical protein